MELSRMYQIINKATTGEIVTVDLGRKNDIRAFILSPEKPTSNASTMKKFETIEEPLASSEDMNDYNFINTCYYTEKSIYGVGSENRRKSK